MIKARMTNTGIVYLTSNDLAMLTHGNGLSIELSDFGPHPVNKVLLNFVTDEMIKKLTGEFNPDDFSIADD